tara:strand:+ start:14 stop:511 length:498 start_codon:yes stop_codon:yes gene_type:complete
MKNINKNENVNEEMNAQQLTEMYNEVITKHEEAKMAYKKAKTEEERLAVINEYPNYKPGHMPMTPARQAFETFKRQYEVFSDLSDFRLMTECERIILLSPDAAEYCFHIARLRQAPWAEAEHRIAESPMWAYMYSRMVLKEPFTAGEDAIHSNEKYSERYTRFLS